MSVYFNKPATVFDEAPFQLAALNPLVTDAVGVYMIVNGYLDSAFSDYILSAGLLALTRESNVTNYYVEGEALNYPRFSFDTLVDNEYVFSMGSSMADPVDRHSMALMTALQYSNAFRDVVKKLPDLVTELLDKNLFATDSRNSDIEDLLRKLLRHQLGVAGAIQPDGMLERFAADMNKLAQNGGMTMRENQAYYNWNNVSKALTAFAMQFYYEDTANAKDPSKQLLTDLSTAGTGSNGVRFDLRDVSKDIAAAMDSTGPNVKIDLAAKQDGKYILKGYEYFLNYLDTTSTFTAAERALIKSMLPALRDWYVQAGASGMNATDTLNRGAFLLGGNGSDALVGGTSADLLVGNAGDDLLQGGQGNDILLGGAGNDTYVYQSANITTAYTGDGLDTILDSDGNGSIVMDGNPALAGGAQYGDARTFSGKDANGVSHLYTFVTGDRATGGDLIVDGAMLLKNYKPDTGNHMGLALDAAVADADIATIRDIYGDLTPDGSGNLDDLGNFLTNGIAAPGRADGLNDSSGNDHIMSGGGDDLVYAFRGGDDIIEAGAGQDKVIDQGGNNVIVGGADGDILLGGTDNDRIYADTQITVSGAIATGNIPNSGSGLKGDWLSGGAGDDTLIGSNAQDVLMGGAGSDLLIGGAGNDDIAGDGGYEAQNFTWTVYDTPTNRVFYASLGEWEPAGGGADVIYAGEGSDHAWGGIGNDVIFGEGGSDHVRWRIDAATNGDKAANDAYTPGWQKLLAERAIQRVLIAA